MDKDGDKVRKLRGSPKRTGLLDYSKNPYRRVHDVMSGKHPEWIEGVLTDMYVNPEYAKILAENALSGAINSEQIVNFLEFTKKSRDARRLEAERKRAAAGPRLATPWSQGMRKMTKEEVAEKYRREKEGAGGP